MLSFRMQISEPFLGFKARCASQLMANSDCDTTVAVVWALSLPAAESTKHIFLYLGYLLNQTTLLESCLTTM